MHFQELEQSTFERWQQSADVLEQDLHGIKVMRLEDGSFVKLFRRKTWLSKTVLFPPAKRFARNARELKRMGVACPEILGLYKIHKPFRSVVHYTPLPGLTVREALKTADVERQSEVMHQLACFVSHLHELGIYFRSLHMGNIIISPDGELGLIDISDMRCMNRPLSRRLRKRNYQHLFRYKNDWDQICPCARQAFIESLQAKKTRLP